MESTPSQSRKRANYRPRCPNCGSRLVVEIFYGVADSDVLMKAQLGLVQLGGDNPKEGAPTHRCNDCGHTWV